MLIFIVAVGIGIAIYDIWQSMKRTQSVDWTLWVALIAIPVAGIIIFAFSKIISGFVIAWVKYGERQ